MTGTLNSWTATITKIIDGDTFEVIWDNGYTPPAGLLDRIRIAGVDTNEISTNEPFADAATARLAELIPVGTQVVLQAIDENSNTLDRPLRHVFVDGVNVAITLISEGLGLAASYDIEPTYREDYFAASESAQLARVGMWSLMEQGDNSAPGIEMFVNYDASGNDANNLNDEYIHITNTSTEDLDLSGWTVRSSARLNGTTIEILDGTVIAAGETFEIFVGSGVNSSNALYLGLTEPIFDNTGDVVYLRDNDLNIQATQLWPDSIFHSAEASIVIDDVQFNAPGDDMSNSNGEWIVVRNAGDKTVDLSDWRIKDDGFDYIFKEGVSLGANETIRLNIGSGIDTSDDLYWGKEEGILNNLGGSLQIWTPYSIAVDTFVWGNAQLGEDNARGAIEMFANYDASGNDKSNPNGEWVALYNSSGTDISLEGFKLQSGNQSYDFSASQMLSAGENLIVYIGTGTDHGSEIYWGNAGAILANSGDSVRLLDDQSHTLLEHSWTGQRTAEYGFGLVIEKVNFDAPGNDNINLNGEWLTIRNSSSGEQNLVNWQIKIGPEQFTVSEELKIGAGETITFYVGSGQNTADAIYMGFDRAVMYNSGSRAVELLTPAREIVETHSWGTTNSAAQSVAAAVELTLNYDAVGDDSSNLNGEWVNIRNLSSNAISLDGHHLYTDGTSYYFDSDDVINAGDRIRAYLGDGTDTSLSLYANGALDAFNNSADEIELRSNETGFAVDMFAFVDGETITVDSAFKISAVNQDAPGSDATNPNGEWIEITNVKSSAADLQDWRIQYQTATFFDFDDSLIVGAGQTIRIYMGTGTNTATEIYWGNTSGILSNTAGTLELQTQQREIADTFTWPYANEGDDQITGTSGNDVINASTGDDRVFDLSGNDVVDLGDGDDYVRVGGGVDSFDGGTGNDYISYYSSSNGVKLDFATDTASGSWAVNDTVTNFESASGSRTGDDDLRGDSLANTFRSYGGEDRLSGRGGDDKLYGGNNNDILLGGSGSDKLFGGADNDFLDGGGGSGIDTLNGGSGADIFHFDRGEGTDIIVDFENNIDVIQFDNFYGTGTSSVADFIATYATKQGNDVFFDFGSDGELVVKNTTLGQLQNDVELV
jgi:endonuclease YncB( thermonuclease family)